MAIIMVKGDLVEVFKELQVDWMAHGCNTKGGFGSGIAGQIAKKYPHVRNAYIQAWKSGEFKLGTVQRVPTIRKDEKFSWIANCGTQKNYLPRGQVHVDYEAVAVVMADLNQSLLNFKAEGCERKLGIPKIGCGLAGGDWKVVRQILKDIFTDTDIYVYYL